jgi:mono/diheme cytochrome c family protein
VAAPRTPPLQAVAMAVALLTLGGCRGCTSGSPPIHLNPNMDVQPKVKPQSASAFFYDGSGMRTPVEGTVAREEPVALGAAVTGKGADGNPVAASPIEVTPELVARGRDRFAIFCLPCHGERADGNGMLKQRAGVQSANLLEDRIRQMPDGQIFDTVTNGLGLMPGYRYPIPAHDRWAIIAYVRQLQQGEKP